MNVYLVNTGITGGAYGVGKRMSIKTTRRCIDAILDGSIEKAEFTAMPIFGIGIPKFLHDVNPEILDPRNTWGDKDAYDKDAAHLASLFIDNFKKYITDDHRYDFSSAGPKL